MREKRRWIESQLEGNLGLIRKKTNSQQVWNLFMRHKKNSLGGERKKTLIKIWPRKRCEGLPWEWSRVSASFTFFLISLSTLKPQSSRRWDSSNFPHFLLVISFLFNINFKYNARDFQVKEIYNNIPHLLRFNLWPCLTQLVLQKYFHSNSRKAEQHGMSFAFSFYWRRRHWSVRVSPESESRIEKKKTPNPAYRP